ncbi:MULTISPECIES: hypothetical protein [Bacillus]|jgi:hypothetical protein|nr:hypothetical protein [Bacillus smithii]AKP47056.1 hypothetical protein BSM4216_1780 [Bacillus smithii]
MFTIKVLDGIEEHIGLPCQENESLLDAVNKREKKIIRWRARLIRFLI